MKVAVGFFDGVHLGHRRILEEADAALTFDVHPASVVAPDRAPALLMTRQARLAAIEKALAPGPGGAPRVFALPFTPQCAASTPSAFVGVLRGRFPGLTAVRCGEHWRFGAKGAGNAAFLREQGIAVEEVACVEKEGARVSSTRIRAYLADGDVARAALLLGRPWGFSGQVVPGKGCGRKLGFPTLNVVAPWSPLPLARGVYAVDTPYGRGVANWGVAPTMRAQAWEAPVLEVHLLAPGACHAPVLALDVAFRAFLRREKTFASVDALVSQIAADCALASSITFD